MGNILRQDEFISYEKVAKRRKYTEIHFHDNYEVYYLLDGETKYFIGDEILEIKKGDIVFIPKGVIHKTDSEERVSLERMLLSFDEALLDEDMAPVIDELSKTKLIRPQKSDLIKIEDMFRRIEKEYKKERPFKEIMLKSYIKQLLIMIIRFKTDKINESAESDRIIYEISEYISANFHHDISLTSLCRQFAFSEGHLSRKFKSVLGMGINEYINYIRILNAEKLLKETDISVTKIAEMCGFHDSNYFSTVFKKTMEITPHKYRKTARV